MKFKNRPKCLLTPIICGQGNYTLGDGQSRLCYEISFMLDTTEEECRLVSDAIVDACVKIESNR